MVFIFRKLCINSILLNTVPTGTAPSSEGSVIPMSTHEPLQAQGETATEWILQASSWETEMSNYDPPSHRTMASG